MSSKQLTYSKAGVSLTRGDSLVDRILPMARKTHRPEILASVGGFAALSRIPKKYKNPLLVVSTDGVGTKVILARELKRFTTVGIDLVAMSVNDILTVGAEPLLFLDYFATGKLQVKMGADLVTGVAKGCTLAGCALVGGETAEMPQVYDQGDFDLAGFCVGVVEKKDVIDGSKVKKGDVLLGVPSSGVHSNGYSLIRAILKKSKTSFHSKPAIFQGKTVGEVLLTPTRIYVREILKLNKLVSIHAMAHITGSGLGGNVTRAFPRGLNAAIDKNAWKRPPIFQFLMEKGNVTQDEMFRTFNMGIGFVVVLAHQDVVKACKVLPGARVIGDVIRGKGESKVVWK